VHSNPVFQQSYAFTDLGFGFGWEVHMATVTLLTDDDLSDDARAVFDDIRAARKTDYVNKFWRALAHDPVTLKRTWESVKQVMGPGALDAKTKEMLYVAVSIAHGCTYCIHSHTAAARAKGMTEAEYAELVAVVGMASETNRIVTALGVEVDDEFKR
jgi:AhpD family alkylhydroperoxidase